MEKKNADKKDILKLDVPTFLREYEHILPYEEKERYWEHKYNELIKEMREEFPHFLLVVKKHSKFNQLLKKLTVWNPQMNESYTTTLGPTIAVNNSWYSRPAKSRYSTLIHERIHMRQQQKYGLISFFFLFALVPAPVKLAYFRKKWEQEAYRVNIYMRYMEGGRKAIFNEKFMDYMLDQFCGPFYLFMWYSPRAIMKWIVNIIKKIDGGELTWDMLRNYRRLPRKARPLRAPRLLRWLYPNDFL